MTTLAAEDVPALHQVCSLTFVYRDPDSGEYSVGLLQVWLLPGMLTANVLAAALLNLWIFVPLGPSAAAGIVTSTS